MQAIPKPPQELVALLSRLQALEIWRPKMLDTGLSAPQFGLLACIWLEPGLHVQDVAHRLGVTTPTVSVALRKLESDDWIERKPDPQDGRSSCLFLSEKGRALARQVARRRDTRISEFMNGLNENEQHQLLGLLNKAITKLEQKRTSKQKKASSRA